MHLMVIVSAQVSVLRLCNEQLLAVAVGLGSASACRGCSREQTPSRPPRPLLLCPPCMHSAKGSTSLSPLDAPSMAMQRNSYACFTLRSAINICRSTLPPWLQRKTDHLSTNKFYFRKNKGKRILKP